MEIKDTEWLSEPKNDSEAVSRRTVLTSALTAGFALAVQPVSAETIITDTAGLKAGMIKFKGADGVEVPAYYAVPAKVDPKKKPAVVLVVQEIFGVHEHIKDVCRRFAKQGYFAIAPELYVREGSVSDKPMNEIFPIVGKVPDAQVMTDLDAAVAYAASTGKADSSRVAITGFCWGGRIVWLYAAHNPKLKAGAAWYGRLVGQSNPLQPKSPTELAASIKAPILGLYGAKDRGIPLDSIEGMRAALKTAGNTKCEILVYPDSEHGFHADYRPSYNEKDAKDGFTKLLAWFKKNGA
ncbi:dienelactone hydrolase family protein [Armatimonas rosea]|uniref:Carboxymethylenebutenolidase n=1 Tax=Armatimonas rosea TaxID=685828 RepID=A0A7W9SS41_ARMRO|nr:dienelactone hydrolase family protein [Armatimonas rosea]MBB6051218.1 carboxymethylenebutenolidase [Armatimonas rosea]